MKNSARYLAAAAAALMSCQQSAVSPSAPDVVGSSSSALRDVRRSEARSDLAFIVSSIDGLYAPLKRKESRYRFDLDASAFSAWGQLGLGRTDSDSFRTIARFLDQLNDGHVSYSASVLSDSSRAVGVQVLVTPIEDKYLAYSIGPSLASQVSRGDELLSIDGRTPQDLVRQLASITNLPNPKSVEQLAARRLTQRGFILPSSLLPAPGTNARLVFKRADGSSYVVTTPWASIRPPPRLPRPAGAPAGSLRHSPLRQAFNPVSVVNDSIQDAFNADVALGQAASLGANTPYFFTPQSLQAFGIQSVRPSDATMRAVGLPTCEGSEVATFDCYQQFAGTYTYDGKRILFIRVPSYSPSSAPGTANDPRYVKALLADYQATSDVLVIDQTHNPGGQVGYCTDLFSLILTEPKTNVGLAFHADRKSINDYRAFADAVTALGPQFEGFATRINSYAVDIERAYDSGQELGPLFPAGFYDLTNPNEDRILPDPDVRWTKPVVVLADELSVSGGDLFPMLVKASRAATLFGARTGGLGGSVEEVGVTPYAQASLRLTRSFFAPMTEASQIPFGATVEDDGITPDVPYSPTVPDFRSGYVSYVRAFSEVAKNARR
jgi:hypothetical protein